MSKVFDMAVELIDSSGSSYAASVKVLEGGWLPPVILVGQELWMLDMSVGRKPFKERYEANGARTVYRTMVPVRGNLIPTPTGWADDLKPGDCIRAFDRTLYIDTIDEEDPNVLWCSDEDGEEYEVQRREADKVGHE